MPESTEVRIMSEFITHELGHRDVIRVEKNPISKNKCDLSVLEGKKWKVNAKSRGKEMMLIFSNEEESHCMKVGFARIGCVEKYSLNEIECENFRNRAMLRMYTEDTVVTISDFTRYIIWRWSDQWDVNRSPDILLEHNEWRAHMYKNRKIEYFKRPIFEIFCDQRFFNGIGTFSRSEILCRMRFSPFTSLCEVLETDIFREDFFSVCKQTLIDIYDFGGLQFEHWTNPFGVSKNRLNKWTQCYKKIRKAYFLRDSKGRKIWFSKKWASDYVKWAQSREVQDTRLIEKIYSKIKTKKQKNGSNNNNNSATR